MDNATIIEQNVSDAVTGKPIRFSVTHKQMQAVNVATIVKEPLHRLLPFLHKKSEKITVEMKEMDTVSDFAIHPPTLGKMQILSKLYLQLGLDENALSDRPHVEAMRVCEENTDIVCQLMAVSVCNKKEDLLDDREISRKAEFFKWNCLPDDFASCILAMLSQIDYINFITSIRLTKMFRQNKPTEKRADRIE